MEVKINKETDYFVMNETFKSEEAMNIQRKGFPESYCGAARSHYAQAAPSLPGRRLMR